MTQQKSGKRGKLLRFDGLLVGPLRSEWMSPAWVLLDSEGCVVSCASEKPRVPASTKVEKISGLALPGFVNAHSHAFQYAMAGLTERRLPGRSIDSFWTWRERMYNLALTLKPGDIEDVTATTYAEMLRRGFTSVVEFHYIHQRPDGKPYAQNLELTLRIVKAAQRVGIDLTIAPVFYAQSDFGKPPIPDQRRFLSRSVDEYLRTWEELSRRSFKDRFRTALTVHSMRAASPEQLKEVFSGAPAGVPRHIHIAEQQKEVDGALGFLGRRPVEWMLENLSLNSDYNFVHATHVSDKECQGIVDAGVNVVICPSTEANLGDGIFPLDSFHHMGGRFTIGTDSHIGLCPFEELRWLEYSQRLTLKRRNVLAKGSDQDTASSLFASAIAIGRSAAGLGVSPFSPGAAFNVFVVDPTHRSLVGTKIDNILPTLIFARGSDALTCTMVRGDRVVQAGRHVNESKVDAAWKKLAPKVRGSDSPSVKV